MKKRNKIKQNIGGYSPDSPFFKMTHQEFVDYCGGQLSLALFRGEFKSELYGVITMAHARGIYWSMKDET